MPFPGEIECHHAEPLKNGAGVKEVLSGAVFHEFGQID